MRALRGLATAIALAAPALSLPATGAAQRTEGRAPLDSATAAAVAGVIDDARAKGLPLEPLYDKVREGSLKGASPTQIRGAVTKLAARLEAAQAALSPVPRDEEIVAGADALLQGAPPDALRRIRKAGQPRTIEVPLGVLAQLVSKGVPVQHATDMVVELLARKVTSAQFVALSRNVESDVANGMAAPASLDLRMKGISAPLLPSQAATAVGGDAAGPTSLKGRNNKPKKP